MDLQLKGKTILVTGSSNGIGLATARAFLDEGAYVVGMDIAPAAKTPPGDFEFHAVSVTDTNAVNNLLKDIVGRRGGLDCVVNNAGISVNAPAGALKGADIDRAMDINVRAVFEISREYFRLCKKQGGNIVNIASILGHIGAPMGSVYGATKGAVVSMTRSLAAEWAKNDFRVNAVCPGFVETAMTEKVRKNKLMFEANIKDVPMKRFARPEEIADACLFLASERSSYVTGQSLLVDGGFTCR